MIEQGLVRIYTGDARAVLRELPDNAVQTVVTSPPYWGLRDYGTASWAGGDASCDHRKHSKPRAERPNPSGSRIGEGGAQFEAQDQAAGAYRSICGRCGAVRVDAQIGMEPGPQAYVEQLVLIFREIRRVLRPDGTLWLNLGDTYCSNGGASGPMASGLHNARRLEQPRPEAADPATFGRWRRDYGRLKPKDLIGVPWRVAFALQDDGWWLRSEIIWAKPNPMPESVLDRPTKAHETVFLLSKSSSYYYDREAILEPAIATENRGGNRKFEGVALPGRSSEAHSGLGLDWEPDPAGRNRRSVWTITTEPYAGAHFAAFPADLVRPCILAGAPEGGVVLDPFLGSGTTAWVAQECGRRAIGIELNPAYVRLALERLQQMVIWEAMPTLRPVETSRAPSGWDRGPGDHRTLAGRYP